MPRVHRTIREDIARCEQALENNSIDEIKGLLEELEITYRMFWKDLNFIGPSGWNDTVSVSELRGIKRRLELLASLDKDEISKLLQPKGSFSVSSTSQNINEISINVSIEQLVEETINQINNNGSIGDKEKKEILDKIEELKSISEIEETKVEKWDKIKPIINWMTTKGVDITLKIIPLVYKILNSAN
jgi:hypothetical protein